MSEERRAKPRIPRSQGQELKLSVQVKPGVVQVVPARLLDLHEQGCGLELPIELARGTALSITGIVLANGKEITVGGRIAWCLRQEANLFRAGIQFGETSGSNAPGPNRRASADQPGGVPPKAPEQGPGPGKDGEDELYEILELSPNAGVDTIHRVYRLMAQRFHPDNLETGNAERFKKVLEAYRTLSDPEARAGYDARYTNENKLRWNVFSQQSASDGVEEEKAKRQGILGLLYTLRKQAHDSNGMTIIQFEALLGIAREQLQFTVWYLKESGLIRTGDNGRFTITVKGVDHAESQGAAWIKPKPKPTVKPDRLLAGGPSTTAPN